MAKDIVARLSKLDYAAGVEAQLLIDNGWSPKAYRGGVAAFLWDQAEEWRDANRVHHHGEQIRFRQAPEPNWIDADAVEDESDG